MEFEACIESLEGALLADKYGADRVELCSALHEGGLSPSTALCQQVVQQSQQKVFAMIRPVAGGFVYSARELELMKMEIVELAQTGIQGVVFGVSNPDGSLNAEANQDLISIAKEQGLESVCHRAFDFTPDPFAALESIIEWGFVRLLSSGQQAKAIEGLDLLVRLKEAAQDRIEIMAGSGLMASAMPVFKESNLDAVHFTVGAFEADVPLGMGARLISDEEKVKGILAFK